MMKPFSGPNFHENSRRCRGHEMPCAYCGKPIKDMEKAVWVFICCDQFEPEGGREVHQNHGNCMESYPLGPECARKYKALVKEKAS